MTAAELARAMGVDAGRVSRLINARTAITSDTALRLADVFGTSAEFWMRLQADYDLALDSRPQAVLVVSGAQSVPPAC